MGIRCHSLLCPRSSAGPSQQQLPLSGATRSLWCRPCHEQAIKCQPVGPKCTAKAHTGSTWTERQGDQAASHQLLPAQKPYSQSCLVYLEGKMLNVMLLKPRASSGHARRTVLPSTVCSESLAHCHEPGKGFFYYPLMRFSLSWLLVSRKSLRKQCQLVLLHKSKAPSLLCLRQPGWFFMAGRSSLSLCSWCQNTDGCPCATREITSASKGREPEGLVSH